MTSEKPLNKVEVKPVPDRSKPEEFELHDYHDVPVYVPKDTEPVFHEKDPVQLEPSYEPSYEPGQQQDQQQHHAVGPYEESL